MSSMQYDQQQVGTCFMYILRTQGTKRYHMITYIHSFIHSFTPLSVMTKILIIIKSFSEEKSYGNIRRNIKLLQESKERVKYVCTYIVPKQAAESSTQQSQKCGYVHTHTGGMAPRSQVRSVGHFFSFWKFIVSHGHGKPKTPPPPPPPFFWWQWRPILISHPCPPQKKEQTVLSHL